MPTRTNARTAAETFEWIGNGTIDDGKVFYSQFKFNGNLISCEDDVIINGNKKCFIGHVEKLYELEGSDDPNRAIIQWYFTYEELLKLAKRRITVNIAEPWRELFLPSSDSVHNHGVEDIDAETISKKCTVLRLKLHDLLPDCLHATDQEDLFYVRYRFDRHFNLHPVSKRVARESTSKRESSVTNHVKTPKTPRRESTRNQNLVKENGVSNNAKTPQTRKTPAKGKDTPSVKKKSTTPVRNKTVMLTDKCVIPLEPLVFNGNSGTPVKRRASRSIPDESTVTSKKSRHNQSAKKTEGPVNSPRQQYGMNYDVLYMQSCTLRRSCYLGQKI